MTSKPTKSRVQDQYNESSSKKVKKYQDPFWEKYYKYSFGDIVSEVVSNIEVNANKEKIRILDLGIGAGLYTHFLQSKTRDIIGVDISPTAVQLANKELRDKASFMLGDGEQLGIKSDTIDIVVCMGTFEYIDNLNPVLAEISRIISSSGHLIFSAHNARSFRDRASETRSIPVAEHTRSELINVLDKHGFRVTFDRTVYAVPNLLKKGFMSERIPSIFRHISLTFSILLEHTAENLPYFQDHGDFWLVSSQKIR